MRGLGLALLAALAVFACWPAQPSAQVAYPGIPWSDLLPPLPGPNEPQPGRVAHCENPPGLHCVTNAMKRLRAARDRFGCDHRAVFATTYMTLTRVFRRMMIEDPGLVRFKRYLFREDALFANVYFRVQRAWDRGEPVPLAWRVALQAGESGDYFGAQDMLLGINAHCRTTCRSCSPHSGCEAATASRESPTTTR